MFTAILIFSFQSASAQSNQQFLANISYGFDIPAGDLASRYGVDYNAGIDLNYVHNRSWFFGVHGHILLGPFVKEDVLTNIKNEDGLLIGQQQNTAIISYKQRGFLLGIHGGKFINISKKGLQHGPRLGLGSSLFTHYIIFNDESATLNQLLGDYSKGYDRLTRGITVEQFIGYQIVNKSGKVNAFAGFQLVQGFTKNLRPVNFDTGMRDESSRLDLLNGFRIGVSLQLYENGTGEDIYY